MSEPKTLRRPTTPSLKLPPQHLHLTADPTSPPETPMASPLLSRGSYPSPFRRLTRPISQDPNIKPVGNGHQFSYQPILGPEQLSPRLSSSSESNDDSDASDEDDDDDDDANEPAGRDGLAGLSNICRPDKSSDEPSDSEREESSSEHESGSDSESASQGGDGSGYEPEMDNSRRRGPIRETHIKTQFTYTFSIEEVDHMDSECEGLDVLLPDEIESIRSRSKSRTREHLDVRMMHGLKNLHCSNNPSEDEDEGDVDHEETFLRRQAEIKRLRRVSMSSSIGKRTFSERSDSDCEDGGTLDVNEVGSSAWRMRKKMNRSSLLFQDPPAPRIDELEEPNSSEDEYIVADQTLAAELPYYAMELIEIESD